MTRSVYQLLANVAAFCEENLIHMRYSLCNMIVQSKSKFSLVLPSGKFKKDLICLLQLQTLSKQSPLRNLHFLNKFPRNLKNTCQFKELSTVLVNVFKKYPKRRVLSFLGNDVSLKMFLTSHELSSKRKIFSDRFSGVAPI